MKKIQAQEEIVSKLKNELNDKKVKFSFEARKLKRLSTKVEKRIVYLKDKLIKINFDFDEDDKSKSVGYIKELQDERKDLVKKHSEMIDRLHEIGRKHPLSSLKEDIKEEVLRMMDIVGLNESHLYRYPEQFSGGQQQRIGIARALITKPKLIIADEPISALDISIQAQVINLLNDLKKRLGLTILFIAHDLRMVQYLSDRVAVIVHGKIVEIGNANEIIQNPIHPYTKSLIASIPTIDEANKEFQIIKYN
jgi:ABC-type oligopeptide transport system ATPase subunit